MHQNEGQLSTELTAQGSQKELDLHSIRDNYAKSIPGILTGNSVEKPFGCRVSHEKMSSIRIQSLVEHDLQEGGAISHLTGSSLKK